MLNAEAEAADAKNQPGQETLLCGGADGVVGSDPIGRNEYPLQRYIEAFLWGYAPQKGLEEEELQRIESLMAELIR